MMDKTMSSAANLANLLPTGTVLAFQALSPSFSDRGTCRYAANRFLTAALVLVCAAACALLCFTDSVRGRDGRVYYGVATWRGLYVLNDSEAEEDGPSVEDQAVLMGDLKSFRLRALDGVHAVFAVVVFLAVALSDSDVLRCFFSEAGEEVKQLLVNLPLGVGFVSSVVFMIFPTTRKGIGYSGMHHRQ